MSGPKEYQKFHIIKALELAIDDSESKINEFITGNNERHDNTQLKLEEKYNQRKKIIEEATFSKL